MFRTLLTCLTALLLGLTLIPNVAADDYHRHVAAEGATAGELCIDLGGIVPPVCVPASVSFTYEYIGWYSCDGLHRVSEETIHVYGSVEGNGANGDGVWHVSAMTFVGPYGVGMPFVMEGVQSGAVSLSLSGAGFVGGSTMSYSGTGTGTVTARTQVMDCPDQDVGELPEVPNLDEILCTPPSDEAAASPLAVSMLGAAAAARVEDPGCIDLDVLDEPVCLSTDSTALLSPPEALQPTALASLQLRDVCVDTSTLF